MTLVRYFVMGATILLAGCAGSGGPGLFGTSDSGIQQQIVTHWQKDYPPTTRTPEVTVSGGMVSLTGTVDSPQARIDAVRDAWQADGVTEVVNELKVADGSAQISRKDQAMTIKLRTRLTFDMDVVSTNYSIETVNGTIYLMGLARDEAELAKVRQTAELTAGKGGNVVSYVRVMPVKG